MTWDATHEFLKNGYYISINTPVNKTMYERAGYKKKNEEREDNYWAFEGSSRHCISANMLPKV